MTPWEFENRETAALTKKSMTLKHDNQCALTITTEPAGLSFSGHLFEMRHSTNSTWSTLGTGTSYSWTTKAPGLFIVRAKVTTTGSTVNSAERAANVHFPSRGQIAGNSTVETQRAADWEQASGISGDHFERGGYIYLNTATDTYHVDAWPVGTFFGVGPDEFPEDSTDEYYVGEYHLHATLRDSNDVANATDYPLGPGQDDGDAANETDTPGLLRDRHIDEIVETGYMDYFYGPIRRSIP